MSKYVYHIRKIWYDEFEAIESDTPLTDREIRKQIDENRTFCDEIEIEEETDDENLYYGTVDSETAENNGT